MDKKCSDIKDNVIKFSKIFAYTGCTDQAAYR